MSAGNKFTGEIRTWNFGGSFGKRLPTSQLARVAGMTDEAAAKATGQPLRKIRRIRAKLGAA